MPQLPSPGSLTRAPWAHPARGPPLALSGVFKSFWAAAQGAAAGFLVGRTRTGRAAASSLRAPLSSEGERVKAHPAPGERAGGRGNPGRVGTRALGFLPGPATAGGHRGFLEPFTLLVWTRVNPRGRFPGGRGGRRAASGSQARLEPEAPPPGGLPAGRDRSPPFPGVRAALPRRAEPSAPGGRRGPKRPYPPQAAPPPCQGRSKQETQDLTWRDPDFWPGFPLSR